MPLRPASNGRQTAAGSSAPSQREPRPACHSEIGHVQPRAGAADDHEVGLIAANRVGRFRQGQQRRYVPLGDRVVRPAGVVADADVAGRHVGQILQHPQRIHLAHRLPRPAVNVEVLLLHPREKRQSATLRVRSTTARPRRSRRTDPGRAWPAARPASCQASSAAADAS